MERGGGGDWEDGSLSSMAPGREPVPLHQLELRFRGEGRPCEEPPPRGATVMCPEYQAPSGYAAQGTAFCDKPALENRVASLLLLSAMFSPHILMWRGPQKKLLHSVGKCLCFVCCLF